jgi:hypothetical protein
LASRPQPSQPIGAREDVLGRPGPGEFPLRILVAAGRFGKRLRIVSCFLAKTCLFEVLFSHLCQVYLLPFAGPARISDLNVLRGVEKLGRVIVRNVCP